MSASPAHLIRLGDLDDRELEDLLDLSTRLKRRAAGEKLSGRSVGLLFFRGSLRTRTAFEAAMHQLGGHTVHLAGASDFWELEAAEGRVMDGRAPEHVKDAAAVLSTYVDALAIRPPMAGHSWAADRRDEAIAAWAKWARVPVINMESAMWHPLQALSDLMTMREALGPLRGKITTTGAPYIQDAVLTGINMKEVGAMIFPTPAVRALSGLAADAPMSEVLASAPVLAKFQDTTTRRP